MKVVLINKSDSTGGAAVVTFRLMEALRAAGVDARMLVAEKRRDSPFVELASGRRGLRKAFLSERLKIFLANGMSRETLFRIDTASDGVPLWRHRWVEEADVVCLNWVNQGLLSLDGLGKLLATGKPVVWTMHDMWCMTGICHHAGECLGYRGECGECPLLGRKGGPCDLSYEVWKRKDDIYYYGKRKITFVAVSHWLEELSKHSLLLSGQRVEVIPNAFPLDDEDVSALVQAKNRGDGKKRIIFGAARLDDPIKGLVTLREATLVLRDRYPEVAERLEIEAFGNVKDRRSLRGFGIALRHLGRLDGREAIASVYRKGDIVVSSSDYETLPGTLVEGQAWGCVPVAFDHGGQGDIIDHLKTGYLAPYSEDLTARAASLAEGILWAARQDGGIIQPMRESVESRFSSRSVAASYIRLFEQLLYSH